MREGQRAGLGVLEQAPGAGYGGARAYGLRRRRRIFKRSPATDHDVVPVVDATGAQIATAADLHRGAGVNCDFADTGIGTRQGQGAAARLANRHAAEQVPGKRVVVRAIECHLLAARDLRDVAQNRARGAAVADLQIAAVLGSPGVGVVVGQYQGVGGYRQACAA